MAVLRAPLFRKLQQGKLLRLTLSVCLRPLDIFLPMALRNQTPALLARVLLSTTQIITASMFMPMALLLGVLPTTLVKLSRSVWALKSATLIITKAIFISTRTVVSFIMPCATTTVLVLRMSGSFRLLGDVFASIRFRIIQASTFAGSQDTLEFLLTKLLMLLLAKALISLRST